MLSRLKKHKSNHRICATEELAASEIRRRIEKAHFGHWSAEATYQNAKMEWGTWPRMRQQIEEFVKRCPNCAFSGATQARDGPNEEVMTRVGQRVHLDFAGPYFDRSYILIVVDEASRFVVTRRTFETGASVATEELDRWIQRMGPVVTICGDDAAQWRSRFFRGWAANKGIEIRLNPGYYHQGNAICERAIQTLQERIRRILNGSQNQWPEAIEAATYALNESWHSSIRTCPQALALGNDRNGVMISEEQRARLWEEAVQEQTALKKKEAERFQWKHPFLSRPLKLGDKVLRRDPVWLSRPLKKLSPKWIGPYTIRGRKSRTIWWISRDREARQTAAHSSQLRLFYT